MRRRLAASLAVALVSAASVLAARGSPHAETAVIAHDEAVVSGLWDHCLAFSPRGCSFGQSAVSSTATGELLFAIDLEKSAGDSCGLGIVYFFEGEHELARTGKLPPRAQATRSPNAVRSTGPGRFAVRYAVDPSAKAACLAWGSAGSDTYTYTWNGSTIVPAAGTPPHPPRVLAPGY
jgi:hypothetical protein